MSKDGRNDPEKVALKSETSLRLLIENLKDVAIVTLDLEGYLASWNIGAEHILGYAEPEILGKSITLIFTPEDRAMGADVRELKNARRDGRAEDERWHLRKDGTRFYASGILTLLRDDQDTPYGYAKIMRDLTERKQAEESLQAAYTLLEQRVQERTVQLTATDSVRRELIRKLVTTQEEERTRIARELHDQTGQQLTTLIFGLNSLKRQSLPAAAHEALDELISFARVLIEDVHSIALSLRPPVLDVFGLDSALQDYGQKWSGRSEIAVDIESIGFDARRLPSEIETTIYRIVQEALTNIMRHGADATLVHIRVVWQGDQVTTTIEDNGPGFDVVALLSLPPEKRRLGLLGMQERTMLMGGALTVESTPGHGTTIRFQLPTLGG